MDSARVWSNARILYRVIKDLELFEISFFPNIMSMMTEYHITREISFDQILNCKWGENFSKIVFKIAMVKKKRVNTVNPLFLIAM